jgi:hypothetical protein
MRRHSRYLISGLGGAVALGLFVIGLELSATTAWSGPDRASQRINPHQVNRTLKGDRLPLIAEKTRKNAVNGPLEIPVPRVPAAKQELPDGCEPIVSAIAQSPLSRIPGRCLS